MKKTRNDKPRAWQNKDENPYLIAKEEKPYEAQVRKDFRAQLTPQQQIQALDDRPGLSRKEVKRLQERMTNRVLMKKEVSQ
jgi:hypothetical protein